MEDNDFAHNFFVLLEFLEFASNSFNLEINYQFGNSIIENNAS